MHLQCVCVLLSASRVTLLDHVITETGISKVLTVDDATVTVSIANCQAAGDATGQAGTTFWLTENADIGQSGGVCLLTSGTVGKPKVVFCTWNHMLLQGEATHRQLFPQGPARIVCGTSISHAFSINAVFALFTSPFDAQSELCFASSPVGLYSLLAQRSALFTVLYATPGIYIALATMPPTLLYADVAYCAGARLSQSLFRKMRDNYGLLLMQNYGSTETGDIAAWHLRGKKVNTEVEEMESSEIQLYVGTVWPGVQAYTNDNGEIAVETPWQSGGYVKARMLHGFSGAHITSDLGVISQDDDGVDCVWLQERLRPKVEAKWEGQRTTYFPTEIEAVLIAHPCVSDVLVLIQSEANREQGIIRARVVLYDNAAANELGLIEWCTRHNLTATFDCPQWK
uniref:AMP-dependent synthetase/ligase domain-containing protein n=1 Tax=Hyaloperonospora arabidopsidis (strain Emoy2) TaxID=559515 RepID=M4BZK2_HYAAE